MSTLLTPDEVQKVARLARLKLADDEIAIFTRQLGQVLEYVDILREVDTESVEPMAHAAELRDVFRADELRPSLSREVALANSPKTDGQFFLVPQILDGG